MKLHFRVKCNFKQGLVIETSTSGRGFDWRVNFSLELNETYKGCCKSVIMFYYIMYLITLFVNIVSISRLKK